MDPKQWIGVENGRIKKKQDEDALNKAGILNNQLFILSIILTPR